MGWGGPASTTMKNGLALTCRLTLPSVIKENVLGPRDRHYLTNGLSWPARQKGKNLSCLAAVQQLQRAAPATGPAKRVNRKLKDLVMIGKPGNVGGTNERRQPEKIDYPNGKLAVTAYGHDVERELY